MSWTGHFTNPEDFPSKEKAIELVSEKALDERSGQVSPELLQEKLTERFEKRLQFMTEGKETLTYGKGRWIEMIRGKKVLPQLLNSGGFEVEDTNDPLTGKGMEKRIVKELAVKDVDSRPLDLVELQRLIRERVGSP